MRHLVSRTARIDLCTAYPVVPIVRASAVCEHKLARCCGEYVTVWWGWELGSNTVLCDGVGLCNLYASFERYVDQVVRHK